MHSHFIRRNVILWPARFMMGKGFTVPAARYEQIMRDVERQAQAAIDRAGGSP
jgi:hypothetical protein